MKPSREVSEQQSFFYVLWPEEKTTSVASAITLQSPPSVAGGNTEMIQADHLTEETRAPTQPGIRSSDFQEASASHRALVSNSETSSSTDSNTHPLQLVPPPPKRHCSSSSSSNSNNITCRSIQGPVATKSYLTPLTQCLECEVKDAEITALRRRIQVLQEHLAVLVEKRNINHWPATLGDSDNNNTSSGSANQSDVQDQPLPTTNHHQQQPLDHDQQRNLPNNLQETGAGNQDMVELVSGSGVYITSSKLEEALGDAKNGTQLARKLMDAFWDKATLAKSSVSSRSKYQYEQLDPKIIAAIESHCLTYDKNTHLKDLHATMTDKCCQCRRGNNRSPQ